MEDRLRYSFVYLVYFAALSGFGTFRNVFLQDIGMTGVQMGIVGAVITVFATASQPLWGVLTDWRGAEREVLVVCALATGVAVLAYPAAATVPETAFLVVLAGTLVYAVFHAPISPITDSLVLSTDLVYGRVRAFGSVAFGVGSLVYGLLIAELGSALIFYVYSVGMVALALAAWGVRDEAPSPIDTVGSDALRLVTDRDFLLLLASALLVGVTLLPGNDFFSVYVRSTGASDAVTGLGWFVLTASEAAAFVYALRFVSRYRHLLVAGAVAYAAKYSVYYLTGNALVAVASHAVTGVSFAAFYLAAVNLADEIAPDSLSSTAQTLLWSATFGVGASVGHLAAGTLVSSAGVRTMYGALSLVALAGGLVALLVRSEAGSDPPRGGVFSR